MTQMKSNMIKIAYISFAIVAVCFTFVGFSCENAPKSGVFFKLERFSSIPMIRRVVTFSNDSNVTIYEPPNTKNPFTYSMSSEECDSLRTYCSAAPSFDTLYFDPKIRIPNPSAIIMEFTSNSVTKQVRISQYPHLPDGVLAVLTFAAKIESRGLNLMEKQGEEKKDQEREEKEQQQQEH